MVRNVGKKRNKIISNSPADMIFDITNICIMILLLFIFVWPLWFVVIASFSNPHEVWAGKVLLWPVGFTLQGYKELLNYSAIWIGYRNNIFYTVVGTLVNMIMTILCAYPLSRIDWKPRRFFVKYCLITMYVSGGLIPTYLVVRDLHLVNTPWVMIIPGALSFYNALIVRSYFMNSIPGELQEAATLDGANNLQYLVKVVLPLSKPVLAVVVLYYAVAHWNDYYTALIYINNNEYVPLQTVLRRVLITASQMAQEAMKSGSGSMNALEQKLNLAESLKYTSIIAGVLPMLIIYPFVQKYFVKGVMVGAIKG